MDFYNLRLRAVDTLRRWGVLKNYRRESNPLIDPYLNGKSEDIVFNKGLAYTRGQGEWGQHPIFWWQRWRNSPYEYVAPLPLNAIWDKNIYNVDAYESKYMFSWPIYIETEVSVGPARNLWCAPLWHIGESVPPEPDCAELYSDEKLKYSCQSNFHYGEGYAHDGKESKSIRAAKHAFFPEERNRYGTLFEKDKITYFYNRHAVRVVRREDVDNNWSDIWNVIVGSGMKEDAIFTKDNMKGTLWSAKAYSLKYEPTFQSPSDFLFA